MSLDEYFATGPAHERPIFDAVMAHLEKLGPVHVEPVSVGIFLKSPRKFVELRPKQKWVALSFVLSRSVDHPKIARKLQGSASRTHHVVNLCTPADVDADVCGWLTESYLESSS
ncbi:MAG: hypothetical protein QOC92_3224 [Acidimicrobiaceae bacterium]|jgi:hypothetical protein